MDMCVHIYVCVYVYMWVCVYYYIMHVGVFPDIAWHTIFIMCACVCVRMYVHICVHACEWVCVCVLPGIACYMYACMNMYMYWCECAHVCVCVYVCVYKQGLTVYWEVTVIDTAWLLVHVMHAYVIPYTSKDLTLCLEWPLLWRKHLRKSIIHNSLQSVWQLFMLM